MAAIVSDIWSKRSNTEVKSFHLLESSVSSNIDPAHIRYHDPLYNDDQIRALMHYFGIGDYNELLVFLKNLLHSGNNDGNSKNARARKKLALRSR